MTFSIEVLPAPFGPIIARISERRISMLIAFSAVIPPKASVIRSAVRIASPICFNAVIPSCPEGAGPEAREHRAVPIILGRCSWVPGSQAEPAPQNNDWKGPLRVHSARLLQRKRFGGRQGCCDIADRELGAHVTLSSVLEGDLGLDAAGWTAEIKRID